MKFDAWPVEPPGFGSIPFSSSTMSRQPRRARCQAMLLPTMPAPMMTTRACAGTELISHSALGWLRAERDAPGAGRDLRREPRRIPGSPMVTAGSGWGRPDRQVVGRAEDHATAHERAETLFGPVGVVSRPPHASASCPACEEAA